jgi:hypothetical protein
MAPREPTSRLWLRAGAVLAVWCAATVAVLAMAADTKIGPIMLVLSRRHGVHAGDLVVAVVAYAAAAVLTWRLLVRWRVDDRAPQAAVRAPRLR